ncbi:hypothetical protein D5282_24825 [bacterium 1xD8-48]|jgi:hypothetical protein|nr:hypothetical protein [bacterium 1xD8-48]
MLERFNWILNIIMGSTVGVLLGHGIYLYWDYRTRPGLYEMQSAPWYTSILVYGLAVVCVLILCFIMKLYIRKRMRELEEE